MGDAEAGQALGIEAHCSTFNILKIHNEPGIAWPSMHFKRAAGVPDNRGNVLSRRFKILLINPPHIQKKGLYPRVVFEPLGLAYVGAYLEKEGYDVSIVDAIGEGFDKFTALDEDRELVGLTYEEIGGYVREMAPQVVGIGIPFTMRAESAFKVASTVKAISSDIVTVVGGIHVSTYPEECISQPHVDYIVAGEGELPMAGLLKVIQKGSLDGLDRVKGIGFKKDGRPVLNPREEPIKDLDALPYPARHLLPMERYFEASRSFKTGRHGKKFACILTSRGCPFKCNFCVSYKLMGRIWRYRSPENVVDEIEALVKDYGVSFIHFEDDNMTLKKERVERICDLIIERGLKIRWDTPNGIMAHTIADEGVLRKMKASGCQHICVAPESGNQYVVDNIIKKKIDLGKIEEVVKICKRIGLKVDAFFVIGLVGETKEQIEDSIRFARKLRALGASRCHFHIATPFEGTEMYAEAKKKGYLVDAPDGCIRLETPRISTDEFTVEDIDRYFTEGNKVNPVIPTDKLGLIFHLLYTEPWKLMKSSVKYFTKRLGGLSG